MAVIGTSKRSQGGEAAASADKENGGGEEVDPSSAAAAAAAAATSLDLDELVGGDEDIAFEQELRRDPYQVKVWLAYLKSRAKAKPAIRYVYLCFLLSHTPEYTLYIQPFIF